MVENLNPLPDHLNTQRLATPQNDKVVGFFTKESPLSNHYPCVFTVNDYKYNCVDQYLTKTKALHFKDTDNAAKVMQAENPGYQKGLGKKVTGFDLEEWCQAVPGVLKKAVLAQVLSSGPLQGLLERNRNSYHRGSKPLR